jgi:transcriptional regulator with XRE-family HTH domain
MVFSLSALRIARLSRRQTLDDAALLTGADPSLLSRIERGLRQPSPELAKRLAELYALDPSDIATAARPRITAR